jgi:hypothetical protein
VLAHGHFHRVLGITLSPSNAKCLFIAFVGLANVVKKSLPFGRSLPLECRRLKAVKR